MAREPKTGIVQTRLGPLPEDFFVFEGLPDDATPKANEGSPDDATPKAKLRAQLAQSHGIWRGAKDDQEGQNQRWYAYQVALRAVLEYVRDDVPPEHLYLLVRLAEYLDDLKLGRQPEEMKPALRERLKRGNPGLMTDRAATLAAACAMVAVLSRKGRRPSLKKKIKEIEEEVAEAIGEQPGAFRSWRKAFNVGGKGTQAPEAYDGILRMLQEQPDPKQAARILLETHRRALKKFA
jgi:hypothetical protein